MIDLNERKNFIYPLISIIIAVTISLVIAVYSLVTNNIVESKTVETISELAKHDKNTIYMFISYSWRNLERVGMRLERCTRSDDDGDLYKYINYEITETTFDDIFFLAEDGTYYTKNGVTEPNSSERYDYNSLFRSDSEFCTAFDSIPEAPTEERVVIYGYKFSSPVKNLYTGGKDVCAIIGVCKRSSIKDGLIINSFEDESGFSRGHSSLIDKNGDYVVEIDDGRGDYADNWLTHLEECEHTDYTRAQAEEKIKNGETFWFYHTDDGMRKLNYCVPLSPKIDWYFLLTVDDTALAEQSEPFVVMIIVALAITILVLICAVLIIAYTHNKTVRAIAQEKAQSEFLSNMSHEIRTPLNGIVGLNYLIMTNIDDEAKKPQVKEWLEKSHGTANYLLSLINDILDLTKLKAGKVEMVNEPFLIGTVTDAIRSMLYDTITEHGITYTCDDGKIIEPCVSGDQTHIKQVLMNIVGNATKFTPAGGFIKLTVSQFMLDDGRVSTSFVCEDSGCGMSKEFVSKIFDAFAQDRNSNSSSIKGTGLGMAISKLLVDAMGGTISVESELGKGSKFTVTIPFEPAKVPEYMKIDVGEEQPCENAVKTDGNVKVLMAEDNELNAEILSEILTDENFEVVHAVNGQEAVEFFEKSEINEFGVILMDMQMPVMDGCAATEKIRALDRADAKTVPIFACTANSFKEDRVRAFASGMTDFLAKPIDVKVLLQKMENIKNGTKDDTGDGNKN